MKLEKCKAIVERDRQVIAPCQHLSYFPLAVEKYCGAVITDADGNEFVDFLSGAASTNLGGLHPAVASAIKQQLEDNIGYSTAYSYGEPSVAYAERLVSIYPGGVRAKVAFGNSGSDSNDAAVKFARAYTGRDKIIVFVNGYHGSTYGSASLSTCSVRARAKIGPFLPGIYAFPFYGEDVEDDVCEKECVAAISQAFTSWLPASEVAAVIIEPIQGDIGILPAHPIFMNKLYELCKGNGILFISEEVQHGFLRAGHFFGIEHYGIVPDGIIMGKAAGGGLPLGAFMARAEIMDTLPAPAHVFTMSGNSLVCAAACAAFDVYQSEQFQTALSESTDCLWHEADALRERFPELVQFVRGVGLSAGIGICRIEADGGRTADPDAAFKILYRCYETGLVLISLAGNVLRIQPPLVITPEQIQQGFSILARAMEDYEAGRIGDEVLINRAGW